MKNTAITTAFAAAALVACAAFAQQKMDDMKGCERWPMTRSRA